MAKKSPRELLKRAQNALRELELGVLTQADKKRIGLVWQGFHYLDEEQANIKYALEELLVEEFNPNINDDFERIANKILKIIGSPIKEKV